MGMGWYWVHMFSGPCGWGNEVQDGFLARFWLAGEEQDVQFSQLPGERSHLGASLRAQEPSWRSICDHDLHRTPFLGMW